VKLPTISLPNEPTDKDIIGGLRGWLELLAKNDYPAAMKAVYFRWPEAPESFKKRIEEFFGAAHAAAVASPTEPVLARSEIYRTGIPSDCKAVVGFFIPLKNDLGIWTTFFVRQLDGHAYFEFEILHL
jgi:hypothetical protein